MAVEWEMVRLRASVGGRLRERLARLQHTRSLGHAGLQRACPQTLGEVIEYLLNHIDNDDRRKRESAKRVAERKAKSRHHILAHEGGQL